MEFNNIQSCHLGPDISPEQFIPEHFFLHLLKGSMKAYDGYRHYNIKAGDYFLARKHHLVRYTKYKTNGLFEKVIIVLDEAFLKRFLERHPQQVTAATAADAFLFIPENPYIQNFIRSLEPYYNGRQQLDEAFTDIKREELLLILLKSNPALAQALFNFGAPEKIDLEAFMQRNFRFNIGLERFAYLTGRSLSTFKRDFHKTFGVTPGSWLTKKRLEEAYFLLRNQGQKPGEVYAEVGFEDVSHFSFAFKKQFGQTPTEVMQ